jgi:hypothetical protein
MHAYMILLAKDTEENCEFLLWLANVDLPLSIESYQGAAELPDAVLFITVYVSRDTDVAGCD